MWLIKFVLKRRKVPQYHDQDCRPTPLDFQKIPAHLTYRLSTFFLITLLLLITLLI